MTMMISTEFARYVRLVCLADTYILVLHHDNTVLDGGCQLAAVLLQIIQRSTPEKL